MSKGSLIRNDLINLLSHTEIYRGQELSDTDILIAYQNFIRMKTCMDGGTIEDRYELVYSKTPPSDLTAFIEAYDAFRLLTLEDLLRFVIPDYAPISKILFSKPDLKFWAKINALRWLLGLKLWALCQCGGSMDLSKRHIWLNDL